MLNNWKAADLKNAADRMIAYNTAISRNKALRALVELGPKGKYTMHDAIRLAQSY